MSELAARLLKRFGTWGECEQPCSADDKWQTVAAEALAWMRETLGRERLAKADYERIHLGHAPTWEQQKSAAVREVYLKRADVVLALLDKS